MNRINRRNCLVFSISLWALIPGLLTAATRTDPPEDRRVAVIETLQQQEGGVLLDGRLSSGEPIVLRIEPLTGRIVRVRASLDGSFEPTLQERDGFIRSQWPGIDFSFVESANAATIGLQHLSLRVTKAPFQMSFIHGDKALSEGVSGDVIRLGERRSQLFMKSPPDERFVGFGDQGSRHGRAFPPDRAPLEHRGARLLMAGLGSNRIYYVPFFMSSRGYGLFVNTLVQSDWDMAASVSDRYSIRVEEPRLDFYFIAGPSFSEILENYTEIVGRPPLPPQWPLGERINAQLFGKKIEGRIMDSGMGVRWFDQKHIRREAQAAREEQRPVDFVLLDSAWQTVRNSFEWVPQIPDPGGMMDFLEKLNFQVVLWQRATPVQDNYQLFKKAKKKGYLVRGPDGEPFICEQKYAGPSGLIDFTNPEAVHWWQEQQAASIRQGADSFKLDSASSGFIESYPEALEMKFFNGMTGRELDNYYGPLYLKTVWDGLKKELNGRRAVLFTYHSTYFAGGKYPFMALGDRTRHSTRELQSRYAQNYGLSGIPFWEGGEFSSFGLPLVSRELQMRLIPYTYTYWDEAHRTGLPVIRAMVLEHHDDPAAYRADTQFLYGDHFLVAPVLKGSRNWRANYYPEEDPETLRVGHYYAQGEVGYQHVYLPAGEWIDYWTQEKYRGPRWKYFRVEDGKEPIFVRGGAIIPMGPSLEYTGQKPLSPLTLEIYPQGESSFVLYEDDGKTYAYESGEFSRTRFTSRETADGIEFEIVPDQGRYGGKLPERDYILLFRGTTEPDSVQFNSRELPRLTEGRCSSTQAQAMKFLSDETESMNAAAEFQSGWCYQFNNGYDRAVFVSLPDLDTAEKQQVQVSGTEVVRYYMD